MNESISFNLSYGLNSRRCQPVYEKENAKLKINQKMDGFCQAILPRHITTAMIAVRVAPLQP